ncbi:MAG: DUF2961 domain-containing protein [Bacteroidetes bacterium]|nr:DUF2961 domain-containing protein [Bacteroidota bacterium]
MKYPIGTLILLLAAGSSCVRHSMNSSYPKASMEYPEKAITQRASSYDRDWENGNADARRFDPGQTRVLADLEGPGRITHIWFTAAGYERGFPRSVVVRMYWDGSEEPAVEAPLGDFFAAGHGMQVNINSSRVATSSFGRAYNCYWNMPFRKSARITVTNESERDTMGLYWYIDWEKRSVPNDVPYFHAQYRQENPPMQGEDYLIADIEGAGHYVGTVLSVRASQPGWFGEGDDRFYVDGDSLPTLHGTGTEDYFNDAWAFRVVNRPNYGVSIWEGMNTGSRITAYRWHVTDPVFFEQSLRFSIEHKGNTFYEDNTLAAAYSDRRPDFYSSVAFWYQLGEAKRFAKMPPVVNRMATYTMIQVDEILEDSLPENTVIHEDISYTNRKGLHFTPTREGEVLKIPFEVSESGNYLVFARLWPRGDAGIYDLILNDQLLIEARDLFEEHHFVTDIKLGNMQHLDNGTHYLKAVYRGTSNSGSPGNLFIDAIVLEPIGSFEE